MYQNNEENNSTAICITDDKNLILKLLGNCIYIWWFVTSLLYTYNIQGNYLTSSSYAYAQLRNK